MLFVLFSFKRSIVISNEIRSPLVSNIIHYFVAVPTGNPLRHFSLILVLLFGCAHNVMASPQKISSIMVLGDSISAGYGLKSEEGWVNLLKHHLLQQHSTDGTHAPEIINASISGETTGGALARLPKLLKQYQPSVVIVELGGNDGLRGHPIQTLRQNLNNIVQISQAANAEILIVGMRIPPNYGKRYNEMFYDSFQQAAKTHKVALVPFLLDNIAIYPELMQKDGIHPTAQAQSKILDNVLPQLNQILKKL